MSQLSSRFSASVLKNVQCSAESAAVRRFPLNFQPRIGCAVVPDRLVAEGATVADLASDLKYSGWYGSSGKEVTYVMIQHVPQPDVDVNVQNLSEILTNLDSLEWLTSEHARVKGHVAFPSATTSKIGSSQVGCLSWLGFQRANNREPLVIPHGYMVSLSELEQCLGTSIQRQKDGNLRCPPQEACESRPAKLRFFLPEFDVIPSAHTQFACGDKVFFGCRAESFRFIIIDNEGDLETLRESLDDEMKVTKMITVTCTKEDVPLQGGQQCQMTLLPGFEFQGHFVKKTFVARQFGVPLGRTLQFKVLPESIVKWNFRDGLLEEACKLDFDFFRVAHLDGVWALRDPDNPLSRYALRVNIVGVARQPGNDRDDRQGDQVGQSAQDAPGGTQDRADNDYQIEWCCGPESRVKNDDLVLLPRLPAKSGIGYSQSFWKDADVSSVAHSQPIVDESICDICAVHHKDRVLVSCGHRICHRCATNLGLPGGRCPYCRSSVIWVQEPRGL